MASHQNWNLNEMGPLAYDLRGIVAIWPEGNRGPFGIVKPLRLVIIVSLTNENNFFAKNHMAPISWRNVAAWTNCTLYELTGLVCKQDRTKSMIQWSLGAIRNENRCKLALADIGECFLALLRLVFRHALIAFAHLQWRSVYTRLPLHQSLTGDYFLLGPMQNSICPNYSGNIFSLRMRSDAYNYSKHTLGRIFIFIHHFRRNRSA